MRFFVTPTVGGCCLAAFVKCATLFPLYVYYLYSCAIQLARTHFTHTHRAKRVFCVHAVFELRCHDRKCLVQLLSLLLAYKHKIMQILVSVCNKHLSISTKTKQQNLNAQNARLPGGSGLLA